MNEALLRTFRNHRAALFVGGVCLAVTAALLLRGLFQPADPPWHATVGITWHDEGVWAHNARNRVLFGTWTTDGWNPMYVSPVFTAVEWASFRAFGVGFSQARLPSILFGALSVAALAIGIRRLGTRGAALLAAWLAASNYIYVMYGRVALLEATMTGLMVIAWCCYVLAERRPWLGLLAGTFTVAAFLTKASAAFFVLALGIECVWVLGRRLLASIRSPHSPGDREWSGAERASLWTLGSLAGVSAIALLVFVAPNWGEWFFYNFRLYGQRRTLTGVAALVDHLSWFPIVHDFFTRMFVLTWLSLAAVLGGLFDWWRRRPGERVLWLWLVLGAAELILHDTGNERRFVFLIPAMVGTASLLLARDFRLLPVHFQSLSGRQALAAAPAAALALFVAWGAVARVPFLYQTRPGVQLAAALAIVCLALAAWAWKRGLGEFVTRPWTARAAFVLAAVMLAGDLAQFAQWAGLRTYKNAEASREVGRLLPPGTQVLGKLANGLALENEIRPLYIGQGFGNYGDTRLLAEVPYVLSYLTPRLGFEGAAILEVLDASPGWRVVMRFPVAETPGGSDVAALIIKGSPAR